MNSPTCSESPDYKKVRIRVGPLIMNMATTNFPPIMKSFPGMDFPFVLAKCFNEFPLITN